MTSPAEHPVRGQWPTDLSRLLRQAGGLLAVALAGLLAIMLSVYLLAGPALEAAARSVDLNLDTPGDTALAPLAERSRVLAADGSVLAVLHDEVDRRVIPLDEVPPYVRDAVLAAEDRRFYDHAGYDIEGIGRALVANLRARGVEQGGSTITQQLAKQNFVGDAQTIERKFNELLHAVALEERFDKDELLERYLNQVYFGGGAYGIAAAAEEFFRAEPHQLRTDQAALLAGMIRAPGSLDPRRHPERAERRRDAVLRGMAAEGHLTSADLEDLLSRPVEVAPPLERESDEPYVVEAVKREFFANPAFGENRGDRIRSMFSGGLDIHTTIDPRMQQIATEVIQEHFPEPVGPTAAIASVDPWTGQVRALHSGADFNVEQFDLATQGRRHPGSAFKTFVMATALERGYPLGLRLEGSPTEFPMPGGQEPWSVRNYGNARYGDLSMTDALVRSVNTAFAQLMLAVGPEHVVGLAERMGFDMETAIAGQVVPALALGGFPRGVTPLEMATGYGVFATGGIKATPFLIERVTDPRGEVVFEREPDLEPVLHETVAATMIDVLRQVVQRGTGTRARVSGWDAAGKTGTSQLHADAWFAGFVPVLSSAVWMGHPEGQVTMPGMAGGGVPATIWGQFMQRALEGVEPTGYREMSRDLSVLRPAGSVTVPDVRRMHETEALREIADARLVANTQRVASGAPAGTVVWQSPRPGSTVTAATTVRLGVSTGRAPPPDPDPDPDPDPEENPPGQEGDSGPPAHAGESGRPDHAGGGTDDPEPETAPEPGGGDDG